jgi:hypothetical protein
MDRALAGLNPCVPISGGTPTEPEPSPPPAPPPPAPPPPPPPPPPPSGGTPFKQCPEGYEFDLARATVGLDPCVPKQQTPGPPPPPPQQQLPPYLDCPRGFKSHPYLPKCIYEDTEVKLPSKDAIGAPFCEPGWEYNRMDDMCYRRAPQEEPPPEGGGDSGGDGYQDPYNDLYDRINRPIRDGGGRKPTVTVEPLSQGSIDLGIPPESDSRFEFAFGGPVYNQDIDLSATNMNPLAELTMYDIPPMPQGLGSEDYRMMRRDPNYAAGGLTSLLPQGQPQMPPQMMPQQPQMPPQMPPQMMPQQPQMMPQMMPPPPPPPRPRAVEEYNFGFAEGGITGLPEYQAGGKLLRGPGDGMSDDIVANIEGRQEARLADGEFVIPADVVSHLGNGSTEAGAKALYAMMDKIRKARTGRTRQAPEINPDKYLPR